MAYTLHPWTIANDRLRAQGWSPTVTNEEACVDAFEGGAWATMSPGGARRSRSGAGAGMAAIAAGGCWPPGAWLRSPH